MTIQKQRIVNRYNLSLLLRLIILTSLTSTGWALQFYLQAGEKRCFSDSATANTKILGEYAISTGSGHMPVDFSVTMSSTKRALFEKSNAARGKFAFVIPYSDEQLKNIHHAVLHKVASAHKNRESQRSMTTGKHRRRLLEYHHQEDHHGGGGNHQNHDGLNYDYDFSVHERPPLTKEEEEEHHKHLHGGQQDTHDHHNMDDDLDMNQYEGINDDEIEEERRRNEQEWTTKTRNYDASSDTAKEDHMFTTHKFEICVESKGERNENKRRVKLIVNKGEAANDYVRLAKKEHMSQLQASLNRISTELHDLSHDLMEAREREQILRSLNETTQNRVTLFAMLSLFSLVVVGGYQAIYTKRFFKRKKLL